nr:MaoC/PaaZ C-terminal domain-containing protein [uncultured Hyphomonas sp.]
MNVGEVIGTDFASIQQSYSARDTILYALGVGFGREPLDPSHLAFLYEEGLLAAPTMANVLGYPGLWMADERFGIDWRRMLHAEQRLELYEPLPASGTIRAQNTVVGIVDHGARGAMLHQQNVIAEAGTGRRLASAMMSIMFRGDGGCGNWGDAPAPLERVPARAPERSVEIASWEAQPLIYRLSGDLHPLHIDPEVANVAGFERPILHGLATMGMAGYGLLREVAGMAPERLRSMAVRFTAPVIPGDKLRFEFWDEGGGLIRFRVVAPERGELKVIDRGTALLA